MSKRATRFSRLLLALLLPGLIWLGPAVACGANSNFNDGWRFHLGDASNAQVSAYDDSAWQRVTLPHPARIEARLCGGVNHPQWAGICWYRKTFAVPAEAVGKVMLVRFEGGMNRAILFANGQKIAENVDGYLPFVGDLSPFAKSAGNITLAVALDNTHNDITGPTVFSRLDFNMYGGLYRPATLIIKSPLHITDEILENKPASGGIFISFPEVSEQSATIQMQAHLRNSGDSTAAFSLLLRLSGLDGKEVARQELPGLSLNAGDDHAFVVPLIANQPRLWSPQAPNLYYLDVDVVASGNVIDHERRRIGIRRIGFAPGGILINGKKLFLTGTNRHQAYPYIGDALPDDAQFRDAFKIKQAGFDYVRLSHYPQNPAFMDACDELGIVTLDPILGWQFNKGTDAFCNNRVEAAHELVRRDRNHASAALWEVSLNESGMKRDFVDRLNSAAHEEYPGDQMFTAGWVNGYDVKIAARQHGSTGEFAHATYPAIISEYGDYEYLKRIGNAERPASAQIPQPFSALPLMSRYGRDAGETALLIQMTNFQEAHNEDLGTNAAGDGLWCMYDYNRARGDNPESSGVCDLFRLPKFAYYFYESQRDPSQSIPAGSETIGGPMVFIASYWTRQSPRLIRVLSNAEEVELFLNGHSIGRQKPDAAEIDTHLPHPPFSFPTAQFEPGELHAVAYIDGKSVAHCSVRTPGVAKSLLLDADLSGRPVRAGGDVIFVHARMVDASGTLIPDGKVPVKFTLDGPATLIGDNPSAAEAGIASILLKTTQEAGLIHIVARGNEMAGEITLKTE